MRKETGNSGGGGNDASHTSFIFHQLGGETMLPVASLPKFLLSHGTHSHLWLKGKERANFCKAFHLIGS